MNARKRARRGPAAVAALVVVALLAALGVFLAIRLMSGMFTLLRADGGPSVPDPQFAEPAATVTRPPELEGTTDAPSSDDDPSAGWETGVQTPVDKTAEQLSLEEAEAG